MGGMIFILAVILIGLLATWYVEGNAERTEVNRQIGYLIKESKRRAGQSARKNNGRQTLKTKIINLIRLLLGIHGPVQLRNARAPSDWQQTVAEQIDREQPWLRYRRP
jgi:hypothetical protein